MVALSLQHAYCILAEVYKCQLLARDCDFTGKELQSVPTPGAEVITPSAALAVGDSEARAECVSRPVSLVRQSFEDSQGTSNQQ